MWCNTKHRLQFLLIEFDGHNDSEKENKSSTLNNKISDLIPQEFASAPHKNYNTIKIKDILLRQG